jgi:hypothetical protein
MDFNIADKFAETITTLGHWKPLFKSRFNNNYFNVEDRTKYEKNLWDKFFLNNESDIVIRQNKYPFNYGENMNQLVVWLRDKNLDVNIDDISNIIKELYPDLDHKIILNQFDHRSIKSVLHYHVILKQPTIQNIHLEKLIIIHRHGNREPITKFPVFEKMFNNPNLNTNKDALLLPIGHQNSYEFGLKLKEIYELKEDSLSDSIFVTSPVTRCKETIIGVINGLGLNANASSILESKILRFITDPNMLFAIENIPEIKSKYQKYAPLISKLCKAFGIIPDGTLMQLHILHTTLICYREMNLDLNNIIDHDTEIQFDNATIETYNMIFDYYQMLDLDNIDKIMSFIIKLDAKLVVCTTHDHLVFLLAKYFAHQNDIKYNFELPHYLSNVRIEHWSDGMVRVYYNNWYLGGKL